MLPNIKATKKGRCRNLPLHPLRNCTAAMSPPCAALMLNNLQNSKQREELLDSITKESKYSKSNFEMSVAIKLYNPL